MTPAPCTGQARHIHNPVELASHLRAFHPRVQVKEAHHAAHCGDGNR